MEMLNRIRGLTKSFGNQVDQSSDHRIEQLKRTKAEVEKNVTRILELIKSEEQGKGKRKASKKEIEVVGLVESLYKEYESLYATLRDHYFVADRSRKTVVGNENNECNHFGYMGSDDEYFSSEEFNISRAELEYEVVELKLDLASTSEENEALKSKYDSALVKLREVENVNKELKIEVDKKAREFSELVRAKESNEKHSLARIQELEGSLRGKFAEAKQLGEKRKGRHFRVSELESILKGKEDQHYVFMKKLEELAEDKRNMQTKIDFLHAKIGELEEELESVLAEVGELVDQKTELETHLERKNIEISDYLAQIESLDEKVMSYTTLVEKIVDGEKKEDQTSQQVMDLDGLESNKVEFGLHEKIRENSSPRIVERKIEDLIEKFRVSVEDKLRLLYQRILIAEQLHYETKESYKVMQDKYKKSNRELEEKIGVYKCEFKKMKEVVSKSTQFFALNVLDSAVRKFEGENVNFSNRISRLSNDLKFAKRWVNRATSEIKRLKHNVDCLVAYLDHKEEQDFSLRDKIWKLEARVSKEDGEKLNLVQEISLLDKKLGKYERLVKEKDDRLLSLGEEKREAIRQLCILIDYQRSRVDHLRLVISNMRTSCNCT